MSTPIQSLNLPVRAENCLLAKGLKTVEELSFYFGEHGMVGLLEIPNLGRRLSHEVADRVNAWMVGALDKNDPEPKPLMASDATLRDYFAAQKSETSDMSMNLAQTLAAQIGVSKPDGNNSMEWHRFWCSAYAVHSYTMADAMLRAREATP